MKTILLMVVASVLWVQVPQWSDDWSKCAVDVPDAACHWYVCYKKEYCITNTE